VDERGVDEGSDDDLTPFRTPLPPDDRIWRHPSELAWPPTAAAARHRRRRAWPVALVSGLCGSVLTVGLLTVTGVLAREPGVRTVVQREAVAPAAMRGPSLSVVVGAAAESVVRIVVRGEEPGIGSGIVVRDDGHLVTNAHVVDGADRITVVLPSGRELRGRLVGLDRETDLAVLRVDAGEPLPVALLGSVDDVAVGDGAIAIGSPLGLAGPASVTSGIVSGLGREVESQDGTVLVDMIQTDAAIAPGSSGGALLDARGAVIGVTTAFAVGESGAEGLGFATPIDVARAVVDDLVEHGRVRMPWLGVKGDNGPGGARVTHVLAMSPAAAGGVEVGDVVVAVGRRDVTSMSSLRVALRRHRPGETVALAVVRDGERVVLDVALVERPD